jgi:amino acid transporter
MGLLEAVSLGVGTMIGASIFTIFGVGATIAGPNLPEALLLSSLLALLVGYSYAKLSAKITSNAGPIEFILRGMGDSVLTGAMSLLMWLSYVVSIALFLEGFAGYLLPLIGVAPTAVSTGVTQVLTISAFVALNFFGSKAVGRAELFIVAAKLLILGLLVVAGARYVDLGRVAPATDKPYLPGTFFAASIFFLSYMGFGLITNASENISNASRNVPRAIYISIVSVAIVYVLVSVVVVGNLPIADIVRAQENALAEAARPALGDAGFIVISIGALFSISSALNATLFGGANVAYTLAKDGELPEFFERKVWFKSSEGLFLTALIGLLLALLLNTGGIASMTSAVFIAIYLFVFVSHLRLIDEVGGQRWFVIFNFVVVLATFVVLMYHQYATSPAVFYAIFGVFALSVVAELVYRRLSDRRFGASRVVRSSQP